MTSKNRVCEIEGCGRPYCAKGLCRTHYNSAYAAQRYWNDEAFRERRKQLSRDRNIQVREKYRTDPEYRARKAAASRKYRERRKLKDLEQK
jgi:hypothetical protein